MLLCPDAWMGCLAIFPILEIYNIYNLHQNFFNQDLDFSFLVQQYCPYLLYTSCIPLFYHFPALVRIRQTGLSHNVKNSDFALLDSINWVVLWPKPASKCHKSDIWGHRWFWRLQIGGTRWYKAGNITEKWSPKSVNFEFNVVTMRFLKPFLLFVSFAAFLWK